MCNTVYCGLINNNIYRNVQEECANRLYRVCTCSSNADDGEQWMFLQFIKLSPADVMMLCRCYDVMRLSLSLGA